jgi:hypothetical protein
MKKLYPIINRPCPKSWDSMSGDHKKRFCSECQLYVHNLDALSTLERSQLLQSKERRCVAYSNCKNVLTIDISKWKLLDYLRTFLRPAYTLMAVFLGLFFAGCATTSRKESCSSPTPLEIQSQSEDDSKSFKTVGVIVEERPLWKRILWPFH